MNRTPIVLSLSASLLGAGLGASTPAQALSGDQESACGAILCLVGGSGVAECAPYLARYFAITAPNPAKLFDRRLDFLNLCPASDLPGDVRPLIARYG
ncbi:MAG: conjugal transfer protein TrbM, partial [Gammaproteobacteria bacterium]|nr:conjugal transfer protein TrbM [Gammaproteobacteria bacterium]